MDAETLRGIAEAVAYGLVLIGGILYEQYRGRRRFQKTVPADVRARVMKRVDVSRDELLAEMAMQMLDHSKRTEELEQKAKESEEARAAAQATIHELSAKVKALQDEVVALRANLETAQSEVDRLHTVEREKTTENADLRRQLTAAQSSLAETQADLSTTKLKVVELERLVHELEAKGLAKDIAFEMLKGQFVEPLINMFQGVLNAQVASSVATAGTTIVPAGSPGSHPGTDRPGD